MKVMWLGIIATLGVILATCGVDFKIGDGSGQSVTYAGLGSYWLIEKQGDGNFVITLHDDSRAAVRGSVTGQWRTQASGFVKLTVSRGTGEFADVATGVVAYGIEIPGSLFILKVPNDDKLIYMPALGVCPVGTFTSNGLIINADNLIYNNGTVTHGEIVIDMVSGTGTADGREFGDDSNVPDPNPSTFNFACDQGEVLITDGDTTHDGVMTNSGLGVINAEGGILMLPQDTTVTLADLAGEYAGIVYLAADDEGRREVSAINMTFAAGGTSASAYVLDSVEDDGVMSGSAVTFAVADLPVGSIPGAFKYSAAGDVSNTTTGLGIMIVVDDLDGSGKTFIAGFGQEPNSTEPYFMFAVEK